MTREEKIQFFLVHEDGDALMEKLGMKRMSDGCWSDDDIHLVWDIVVKKGLPWARRQVSDT